MSELVFQCRCGRTRLEAQDRPIVGTICGCTYCTAAERAFVTMGAPPSSQGEKGTAFVLYRNDRVRLLSGREHLCAYRFAPESPTRRIWAECCRTPILTDYEKGFWLSLFRDRTQLSDVEIVRKTSNVEFFLRLAQTFVAIGFRRPKRDPELETLEERLLARSG